MIDGKPALRIVRLYRWIRRLPFPPQTPAQRAAIARKRLAAEERDMHRFLAATAHMPDSNFSLRGHPVLQQLRVGVGRRRSDVLVALWHDEPRRRAERTAHQVLVERRLYGGPG